MEPHHLPPQNAQMVLRGWQEERRLIHFHISDNANPSFKCSGIGTIEELSPETLRIDGRNVMDEASNGKYYGCTISLQRANSFTLWDWRNIPPEEKLMKELLQDTYDTVVTIALGPARCVLFAMKRSDEL